MIFTQTLSLGEVYPSNQSKWEDDQLPEQNTGYLAAL